MTENQAIPGGEDDPAAIEVPGRVEDVEVVFEVVPLEAVDPDVLVASAEGAPAPPPPLEEADTVEDEDSPSVPKPAVTRTETRIRPEGHNRSATASRARKTRMVASVMQERAKTGYRVKKDPAASSGISPALVLIAAFLLIAIAGLAFYFFVI